MANLIWFVYHGFFIYTKVTKFVPARCSKKQNVLYQSYRYSRKESNVPTQLASSRSALHEDSIVVNSYTHNHLAIPKLA